MNNVLTDGKIKAATAILAKRNAELLKNADVEDVSFPEEFEEKMAALFEKARIAERKLRIKRRIVAAVIAALIAALTACTCIPEIRERVYKTIITHYDRFFRIEYVPENDGDYEKHQFVAKSPTYLPEGYELKLDTSDQSSIVLYYENDNSKYISFSQRYISTTANRNFDNEGVIIHNVKVGDNEALIIEHVEHGSPFCLIYWSDEIYEYTIGGTVTVDEMLILAKSVG